MKILLILIISFSCCMVSAQKDPFKTIEKKMKEQEKCWNKGDIDCFMEHYWKSDSLRFLGKKGVTYGWQNTLDNYKKSYPNKAKMGTLSFEVESTEMLDLETALVIGAWKLTGEEVDAGGYYSLIWKKKQGEWVIVVDHTS